MSFDESTLASRDDTTPTSIRKLVLAITMVMSILLYLDRFAVTIALEAIREDLRMTQTQISWLVSAFFWSYAFCQVPAGWLSDRFGARLMLTIYILGWSAFTGLMGVAHAIWLLLWFRLLCGIAQAGAYPTAVGLIRLWYPVSQRGTASAIVGLGGRIGGALAPVLTAWIIVCFVWGEPFRKLNTTDVLDNVALLARFDVNHVEAANDKVAVQRQRLVSAFLSRLPSAERDALEVAAQNAAETVQTRAQAKKSKSEAPSNWLKPTAWDLKAVFRDWLPGLEQPRLDEDTAPVRDLVEQLSLQMTARDFVDVRKTDLNLSHRGKQFLSRATEGHSLSDEDQYRLNRMILEKLFPDDFVKLEGQGWRQTMVLYGGLGIAIAALFWLSIRNSPAEHPWSNEAEAALVGVTKAPRSPTNQAAFPWRAFLTDISLWGNSTTQFLTNVGWLFILSSLPRYLEKVHEVPLLMRGVMTTFPIGTGIVGMFLGGRCTDWAVRRLGLKWGRRVPLVGSRFTAAAGYGICLLLSVLFVPGPDKNWLPWLYIVGLCLVSASADFGTPSIWAYCQDVGGKFTASILGWGNMWGNLGAAAAPFFYNWCLGETPGIQDWNRVFILGGGAFFISGLSAILLDATKPLTIERSPA